VARRTPVLRSVAGLGVLGARETPTRRPAALRSGFGRRSLPSIS
jgi:hypothetical protein